MINEKRNQVSEKEIRIGNKFLAGNDYVTVLWMHTEFDFDCGQMDIPLICIKETIEERKYIPLDYLAPIPLTPEIIEKCGFRKHNDYYKIFGLCYCLEGLYKYGLFWEIPAGSNSITDIEVKYLHQLQNVLYWLTGEELKINL